MASIWGKISGEMSRMRNYVTSSLGWNMSNGWSKPYSLDSSQVDYELARQLYDNTREEYKLGAGFVKPVINTTAAFIGVPEFRFEDDEAAKVLEAFIKKNRSKAMRTHRNALREGDCYVWLTRETQKEEALFPESESHQINYTIIPPEQMAEIVLDPISNQPIAYVLRSKHTWMDDDQNSKSYSLTQTIKKGVRVVKAEGEYPEDLQTGEIPTSWDFIPIVHFKNEADEHEKFGKSDTEAIEPFIKGYHDVMIHAITGSKMHSTPKLKVKLKDVKGFLQNNFGVDDPAKFAREGGTIDLEGKEALFLGPEDDAGFIEVSSATGDAKLLLQLLFYCIVDTSETPEFVFGVHTPSSLSSVKEQMPVLVRKVERKREQFTEAWQRVARIVLAMTSKGENRTFKSYAASLEWEEVDPRDSKESIEEIEMLIRGLSQAVDNDIMSTEAAVRYLSRYVDTMNDFKESDSGSESEEQRIIKSKLSKMRLEDGQFLEEQLKEIDKLLKK